MFKVILNNVMKIKTKNGAEVRLNNFFNSVTHYLNKGDNTFNAQASTTVTYL